MHSTTPLLSPSTQTLNSNKHPWNSAATIAPLVIGAVGIILTVLYEVYFAQHPFLQKDLFRDASSIVAYIAAGFQGLMVCTLSLQLR